MICPSRRSCAAARACRATRRSSISPSAPTRRAARTRTSGCSPTFTPRRMRRCSRVQSVMLGTGIVGGTLMSIDELSRSTADVGHSTLERRGAAKLRVPPQPPGPPIFDWRELQRWGIPESRLPPGSVVRYRAPSLWQRIQGHGAERGRRAGGPIAPDRRTPVSAPRTAAGRDRQPEEPGARRRRQSPRDDVGADQLDRP